MTGFQHPCVTLTVAYVLILWLIGHEPLRKSFQTAFLNESLKHVTGTSICQRNEKFSFISLGQRSWVCAPFLCFSLWPPFPRLTLTTGTLRCESEAPGKCTCLRARLSAYRHRKTEKWRSVTLTWWRCAGTICVGMRAVTRSVWQRIPRFVARFGSGWRKNASISWFEVALPVRGMSNGSGVLMEVWRVPRYGVARVGVQNFPNGSPLRFFQNFPLKTTPQNPGIFEKSQISFLILGA